MLLFFFLLLLLIIPGDIVGIYCVYSEGSIEFKLDNFNSTRFENEINAIPTFDYKDDNIDMCRIEIYIDYQSRDLIISFADSFDWSELDDGEERLDFLIMFNKSHDQGEYYVLEYACFDESQCEKIFLFNNINWIQHINYTVFKQNLKDLLFQNSNQAG